MPAERLAGAVGELVRAGVQLAQAAGSSARAAPAAVVGAVGEGEHAADGLGDADVEGVEAAVELLDATLDLLGAVLGSGGAGLGVGEPGVDLAGTRG